MKKSPWVTLFEARETVPPHVSSGVFELDGQPEGEYRCWVTMMDGERLVDWNGEIGARSNTIVCSIPSD
jgi:hypothetical protein